MGENELLNQITWKRGSSAPRVSAAEQRARGELDELIGTQNARLKRILQRNPLQQLLGSGSQLGLPNGVAVRQALPAAGATPSDSPATSPNGDAEPAPTRSNGLGSLMRLRRRGGA